MFAIIKLIKGFH